MTTANIAENTRIDYPYVLATVVVPVYNSERYLAECLDSVLAQTHDNLELICVDDGSIDSSPTILKDYARRDPRVHVITQTNSGPGAARNAGLDAAKGKYLYFLDSDDFCAPTLLAKAIAVAERTASDMVAFPHLEFNSEIGSTRPTPAAPLLKRWPRPAAKRDDNPDWLFQTFQNLPWNKVFRTDFLRENGIRLQEDVRLTEDLMLSAPALVLADAIGIVDEPLVTQRQGTGDNTMAKKDAHPLDFIAAFKALKAFLEKEGLYKALYRTYISWAMSGCMYNLLTMNTYAGFVKAYGALHDYGFKDLGIDDAAPSDWQDDRRDEFEHFAEMIRTGDPNSYLCELYTACRNGCDVRELHIENLVRDLGVANDRISELRDEVAARDAEIERLEGEIEALNGRMDRIERSAEYRLGKKLGAVPRKIMRRPQQVD